MGTCKPGQGRKSAAIRSHLQARWASRRRPVARGQATPWKCGVPPLRRKQCRRRLRGKHCLRAGSGTQRSCTVPNRCRTLFPVRLSSRRLRPASIPSSPAGTAPRLSINSSARNMSPRRCPMRLPLAVWDTPTCSPGPGGWAKRRPHESSPRHSTAKGAPPRSPATSATSVRASAWATTSTCWRSTAPATGGSTRSASCARTSTCAPAGHG